MLTNYEINGNSSVMITSLRELTGISARVEEIRTDDWFLDMKRLSHI